jgi:UDP-N-acetylglucosamine/UDP-N-acetylgalactosamine diphosphorylase
MSLERALRARLEKAGQGFLAEYCEGLEEKDLASLAAQLQALDLDQLALLRDGHGLAAPQRGRLAPVPCVPAAARGPATAEAARGREELRAGRVGFVLLAGGQASRLSWDGPKGTFPIGPRTERTLFQVLFEQLRRAHRDHGVLPRLAVTTSSTTDLAVRTFLERNECFGYDRRRLSVACQGSLPALDDMGRLLLAAPDRVFVSPDGHGGAMEALERQGILAHWERQGVTTVCSFQVDNPLLRVVDEDFLGRLWSGEEDIATKVILKREPGEKLGVVVRLDGRPAIVEYSEITPEQAAARDPDGELTWRLGSIAVHAFRLGFLREGLRSPLPLHSAVKDIPCVDRAGRRTRRRGRKYERFVFDLFPRARSLVAVEVLREREYEPVKNADGAESPATVRAALDAEYRRWYREAGKAPPEGEGLLEVSPLEALGPEDLR